MSQSQAQTQAYQDILSINDINYILQLPEVVTAKSKINTTSNSVVKFTVSLPDTIKSILGERLGLNLQTVNEIPMRWIKGDTVPHIDFGDKSFLNTYLVYLNDSPGELIIGDNTYPITQNTGYVFSEGISHKTVNTGFTPRLLLGPMSENAVAVGASTTVLYYFSNKTDADNTNTINAIAYSYSYTVGDDILGGNIGTITQWVISTSSTGSSSGTVNNGNTLIGTGTQIYYLYPASTSAPIPPYESQICVEPPYNATNFTRANIPVYETLISYAKNSPNYPWATGSNAQQIYRSRQDITYFNSVNQQTQAIRTANGLSGTAPYPQFKTQTERLMYLQGQTLTAARNNMTGQNPSAPAGVPCSTIYGIIYS